MKGTPVQAIIPRRNDILAALSPDDYERVHPHLRSAELKQHDVLYETGAPIPDVCFVESGMVSCLAVMESGRSTETSIVGFEGMTGMALFHHVPVASERAIVQSPGAGRFVSAAIFAQLLESCPTLRLKLHRFAYAQYALATQCSACNRRHSTDKRFARWLLLAQDRIGGSLLPLTHQFLGQMLGVRRSTVTIIAEEFRVAGIIQYRRGSIEIVNRAAMEKRSCECYRAIVAMYTTAAALPPIPLDVQN
jgi:CRP-like cAMP-binding protein